MNDDNFDKIFGDKLKAGKDFPFSEEKWEKMEGRLDTYLAERKQKRRWVLLFLPLMILFGLLGAGAWALRDAQRSIQDLTNEVKALRLEKQPITQTPSVSKMQADPQPVVQTGTTVYHPIVVTRYDTVFQTVIVRRELSDIDQNKQDVFSYSKKEKEQVVISNFELKSESTISDRVEEGSVHTKRRLDNTVNRPTNNDLKTLNKTVLTEKEKDDVIKKDTEPTQTNNAEQSDLVTKVGSLSKKDEKVEETAETKQEKKEDIAEKAAVPIIKPIKAPRFEIGASVGAVILGGKNIIQQDAYTISGRAGILLNDRFKIVAEAQYLSLKYAIDEILDADDVPTINAPAKNYVLKQVGVEQPFWHYSLGLEYALSPKRLKPFVGLSIFGQAKLQEKFEYQFQSLRRRSDVYVYKDRNEDTFQTPFLRLRAGVEYPIYRKIKAQAESSYDVKLLNSPQFHPLWQMKGVILYRF